MSENYDLGAIAGEYVVGTLDPIERAFVEKERKQNTDLDAEIDWWEVSLLPLTTTISPIDPPLQFWNRIEGQLPPLKPPPAAMPAPPQPPMPPVAPVATMIPPPPRTHHKLDQPAAGPSPWRAVALAASLLAALAIYYCYAITPFSSHAINRLSILMRDPSEFAFVVDRNIIDNSVTVMAAPHTHMPQGKNFELWLIFNDNPPRSLGVMSSIHSALRPVLTGYDDITLAHSFFEISIEPSGGSPTGAPTGEIVASGKLPSG